MGGNAKTPPRALGSIPHCRIRLSFVDLRTKWRRRPRAVAFSLAEHVLIDNVLTDRIAIERAQDVARGLLAHPIDRFPRDAGHMRRDDHIGKLEQRIADWRRFLLEDVEAGAG